MSRRAVRSRITLATATAVAAALLVPAQGGAASPPRAARDTVEVRGTVVVLAGEDGNPDRYSLLLPSGRTVALAEGFTAEPLSRFAGSVAVPGVGSGRVLTGSLRSRTLGRAAASGTPLTVVDASVAPGAPSPGPAPHTTYVAKVTNFGTIGLTDQQILDGLAGAQQYWVRESSGQVPAWATATGVVPVASGAGSATDCGLTNNGASFGAIADSVGGQAFPGVDFSGRSQNHLVVVVPDGCGGTEASGRGRLGTSFANGGPVIIEANPGLGFLNVLEHEYGHNLGLQHAKNTTAEYGDLYEVMGIASSTKVTPVLGTLYRMEQGILAPGEAVAEPASGTVHTLAPRSAATSGQRSVYFINPDDGKRHFVDFRDGAGADAGTCYGTPDFCNYTTAYGQNYRAGLTITREDDSRGAFLLPAPGNDGALQAGEAWTNTGGSITVTAETANRIRITRFDKPDLGAGSVSLGAPTANRQVTASASIAGATAVRYQWSFNGQPIPQADDPTYTPSPGMAGGTLGVVATGYAVGRDPSPAATASQVVAPAEWYANGDRRYPEISGRARVGEKLTALGLDWVDYFGGKPSGYAPTYKWTRNGKKIKGATSATYRLTAKDLGKKVQVLEYPRATGFAADDYARSEATRKVRIGKLKSPRPTIGGKAKVGKRVVARTGGWTRGTKFRYQWFVGKKAIRGATGKKLRISRSLKGKKIAVKVTGSKKAFKKSSAKSRPKKVK